MTFDFKLVITMDTTYFSSFLTPINEEKLSMKIIRMYGKIKNDTIFIEELEKNRRVKEIFFM